MVVDSHAEFAATVAYIEAAASGRRRSSRDQTFALGVLREGWQKPPTASRPTLG